MSVDMRIAGVGIEEIADIIPDSHAINGGNRF